MSLRPGILSLIVVPALASFSPQPVVMTVLDARDTTLSRMRGVLLHDHLPFRGRIIEHDSTGAVLTSTTYRDGLRDGVADAWYADGRRSYHRVYRQGREDGEHIGWWENGVQRFSYHYRRGLIEGVAREWFRDGTPYREYHYEAGHESGSQRMWWEGGGLRANYVIRNGRRFGLPGIKGCSGLDTAVVGITRRGT